MLGFIPTYFLPMAQGKFNPPIVHIHGLVLFSWVVCFVAQTTLVEQGKVLAHRTWGVVGVSIITAITFIVTWVVVMRIHTATVAGARADVVEGPKTFHWVTMGTLFLIVPAFIAAIANVKQPGIHNRLILLIAMTYDWRTRGRPHPVYLIGGAIALLQQVTQPMVGHSAAWQKIATMIGRLAG